MVDTLKSHISGNMKGINLMFLAVFCLGTLTLKCIPCDENKNHEEQRGTVL